MRYLIPFVAAFLFRAGGSDQWKWCPLNQKLWRWLMGLPLGVMSVLSAVYLYPIITVGITTLAYFIATNVFGYGDKSPTLKYLPQNIKHFVSGFIFGLASWPLIGTWALLQAVISGIAFYLIETRKVNNPWAELLRGFCGTVMEVV